MRIFSFILIGFILPTFVFSNDLKLKESLAGTKWKITKINGKNLPDDAVDLECTLGRDGTLSLNVLEELFSGSENFYKVVSSKMNWFVENKKITLISSREIKPKDLDKAPLEARNFSMRNVCRIELFVNGTDLEEIKKAKGQMFIFGEMEARFNGVSFESKTDLGSILTTLIFEGKRKGLTNPDEAMTIKPIEVFLEKTK